MRLMPISTGQYADMQHCCPITCPIGPSLVTVRQRAGRASAGQTYDQARLATNTAAPSYGTGTRTHQCRWLALYLQL